MYSKVNDEILPAALTLVAGIATLSIAVIFKHQLPLDKALARPVGFTVFFGGIGLVIWSALHIRSAIGGMITTRLDELITTGPYRWVRHPLYLGNTVALFGVVVITRSLFALVAVLLLFLPVEWYRSRLEDRALARKFGDAWHDYASRVGAFLPGLGKVPQK